jgi:hypothetical protein
LLGILLCGSLLFAEDELTQTNLTKEIRAVQASEVPLATGGGLADGAGSESVADSSGSTFILSGSGSNAPASLFYAATAESPAAAMLDDEEEAVRLQADVAHPRPGKLRYSGAAVKAFRVRNVFKLLNPLTPVEPAEMENSLLADPVSGTPRAWLLLRIGK